MSVGQLFLGMFWAMVILASAYLWNPKVPVRKAPPSSLNANNCADANHQAFPNFH